MTTRTADPQWQQMRREDIEMQMSAIVADLRAGNGDAQILRDAFESAKKRLEAIE